VSKFGAVWFLSNVVASFLLFCRIPVREEIAIARTQTFCRQKFGWSYRKNLGKSWLGTTGTDVISALLGTDASNSLDNREMVKTRRIALLESLSWILIPPSTRGMWRTPDPQRLNWRGIL
jgi:hypothetical protein